jgi:tetratricopeptide (TPR) repeat protein
MLHNWQAQRQAGLFLAKAQEAEGEHNLGKALDFYGRYVLLVPKDIDALSQYGTLLADAHAYDRASHAFEAVLRRDSTRSEVRLKAVKAAMASGRMSDARDHLENYLLKESPDDAELLDLEGRCLKRAGEYAAAGRALEASIAKDPKRLSAYAQLIGVLSTYSNDLDIDRQKWLAGLPSALQAKLLEDKDWAEKTADYWADRMVEANLKDPQAYLIRGYRRCGREMFDGAVRDAESALKLHADDIGGLHLAAISCQAAKQLDKAREYAIRGIAIAPHDYRMYEVLAQLELSKQQPDEALKWLKKGVDAEGPPMLWWRLGSLQLAKGKFADARETAEALRTKAFPPAQVQATQIGPGLYADLLDAQIEQVQGHWVNAAKRFSSLGLELKSAPDLAKQAYYSLGKSYDQLADPKKALDAYRQAVDADPMWVPGREAVAAGLASLGRIPEALEEQNSLTKLKDAPPAAWAELVRLSIMNTSRLPVDQRDWGTATDQLARFAMQAGTTAAVPVLRAELFVAQNKDADAEKLITAERDKDPKEITFWLAGIDLAIRGKHWDQANQLLEGAAKQFGDRVPLRLARANYLARKGEKDSGEVLRKLGEKSKEFSRQDQQRLWRGMLPAVLAVKDFFQAQQLCRLLMAEYPDDLRVRLELFDLAAQAKDFQLMDTALDEIQRVESGGPIWHYASAFRLMLSVESGRPTTSNETAKSPQIDKSRLADLETASEHLEKALILRPSWSRVLMLQGLIHEELGHDDAALAKYRDAVNQGETSPEVARRALRLRFAKGEYSAANELLHQLEGQQVPFNIELFREQSRVLGGLQDYSAALQPAERAAADSNDYRDYLWLGQLLGVLRRRDDAEKAFLQAITLKEKAPETWVALVRFYVDGKQNALAEKALASARVKIPADEAPLALAECLEILKKPDEAGQQYALAMKQKPDDPNIVRSVALYYIRKGELASAAEQLTRIVGRKINASPEQIADARGALARVRGDQGGYHNVLEAVRLVDENLAAAPASASNLSLKARLLLALPEPARRREATNLLENLVEDRKNASADDRFRLAQFYLASGDWSKARPQMLALLLSQAKQPPPQYVAVYAQALLDHDELEEARPWVDRLEEIAASDPRTSQFSEAQLNAAQVRAVQLRAEVQYRGGKIDETLATLASFVNKAQTGSPDHLTRMLSSAVQLEALAARVPKPPSGDAKQVMEHAAAVALQQAERGYRKCAADDPKQGFVLVGFLARQKRVDEALKQAEETWKSVELSPIAAASELLMRQPKITPTQLERLDTLLSAALEKHSRAPALLFVAGKLRDVQGKYPEAEANYREIIKNDAKNVAALNELAWLLALRGQQLDDAHELIQRAIDLAGPQIALLDTRANVELAIGQLEKALADMQTVIDAQPAANRYFHLAVAQHKLGRDAEAAETLKKAKPMQLGPNSLHPLERTAYADLVKATH